MRRIHGRWWLCLLVACLASGCGDAGVQRYAAEGTVTLGGQPLPQGVIRFIPADDTEGPGASTSIENGRFQWDVTNGPIAGTHRVEIVAAGHEGFAIDDEQAYAAAVGNAPTKSLPPNPIPPAFNTRSTLKETVKAEGENKYEFKIPGQ